MLHTHSKIWIHIVWATKNREPIINKELVQKLHIHMLDYSISTFKMNIERLNIQKEHVHALIDLPTNIMLSEYVQKIKGESSHWVNHMDLLKMKFAWQRGFGAYSVSASQLNVVKNYIENQSEHHRKKTFQEEYENWKKEYGVFDE